MHNNRVNMCTYRHWRDAGKDPRLCKHFKLDMYPWLEEAGWELVTAYLKLHTYDEEAVSANMKLQLPPELSFISSVFFPSKTSKTPCWFAGRPKFLQL